MSADALLPVKIETGINYAVHDGVRLTGDLYRPDGGRDHPLLIAVHGGGWRRGAAQMYEFWGPWLASRGIALFSVEYRLTEGESNRYPAAVHDVRAAVQFIRAQAPRLGADPARLGLIGDSAGAHLASLVAVAGDHPAFTQSHRDDPHSGVGTAVKAVVGVYGVYDLLAQWHHDLVARPREHITEIFLGTSPIDDRFRFFEASPLSYATTRAAKTSFLISWGTGDDVVDGATQSEVFVTALKQAGCFVRTAVMPGAPHFWMSEPLDEAGGFAGILAPKLLRFLKEQL